MLVLTRRVGENYLVGDTVISLLSVQGNQVRVGVTAEPKVSIVREELLPVEELERIYRRVGYADAGCTKDSPSDQSKPVYFRNSRNNGVSHGNR